MNELVNVSIFVAVPLVLIFGSLLMYRFFKQRLQEKRIRDDFETERID